MSDDDNVKRLPVTFKKPPAEDDPPFLTIVSKWGDKGGCDHRSYYVEGRGFVPVTYQIREGETEVECSRCQTRVDPMFVLRIMATEETLWSRQRQRYMDEMKRLRERSRTKCMRCGYMTEISRR
jgi:hypothetical protein